MAFSPVINAQEHVEVTELERATYATVEGVSWPYGFTSLQQFLRFVSSADLANVVEGEEYFFTFPDADESLVVHARVISSQFDVFLAADAYDIELKVLDVFSN